MRILKYLAMFTVVIGLVFFAASPAKAQVSLNFGVNVGPAPVCPYGYFDYSPYGCAPYGYYGPAWFTNGIFLGAGPWYRGPRGYRGWVDNRFDPRYGYRGAFPRRGDRGHFRPYGRGHFHGNERRGGYENHGDHGDHRHGDYGHGNDHGRGGHGR
ncbi:MAG: hypothetical protein ABI076_07045 [Acidobacteriaceae bacterium]